MAVVMQHALGQIEQGTQLAQSIAVCFHLARIMGYSEEDAATVSGDVAPLVDDMEKAATYDLDKVQ